MSGLDILIFGLIVAALIIVAGLLLSARDTPSGNEQPRLSQDDIAKLNAWNGHGTLSVSEMELLADFRNHPDVAWARGEVRIDNPS